MYLVGSRILLQLKEDFPGSYPFPLLLRYLVFQCGKAPGLNWRLPPNTCVDNRLDGKTIYSTDYIHHNAPTTRTKYEVILGV